MQTAILIILVLILLVVSYIAVGIRIQLRILAHIHRSQKDMKTEIAQLLATVRAETSAVAGFIAFAVAHTQTVQEALDADDTDAIQEANDTLKANIANIAQAIAVNTPAAAEVHADDGGAGDDETAVDVDTAVESAGGDTTVLVDPPVEGDQTGGEATDQGLGGTNGSAGQGDQGGAGGEGQGEGQGQQQGGGEG